MIKLAYALGYSWSVVMVWGQERAVLPLFFKTQQAAQDYIWQMAKSHTAYETSAGICFAGVTCYTLSYRIVELWGYKIINKSVLAARGIELC